MTKHDDSSPMTQTEPQQTSFPSWAIFSFPGYDNPRRTAGYFSDKKIPFPSLDGQIVEPTALIP